MKYISLLFPILVSIPMIVTEPCYAEEMRGPILPLISSIREKIPVRGSMKYRGMEGNSLENGDKGLFFGFSLMNGLLIFRPEYKGFYKILKTSGNVEMGGVFEKGRFYFGDSEGNIMSIDEEGKELFRTGAGNPVKGRPSIAGELILFPLFPDDLLALKKENGEKVWRKRYKGQKEGIGIQLAPRPCIKDELVITGTSDGVVIALNLKNGEEVWRWDGYSLKKPYQSLSYGTEVIVKNAVTSVGWMGNSVYASLYNLGIFILFEKDGELLRSFEVPVKGESIIFGDSIIFSTLDGRVISFSSKEWKVNWEFEKKGDMFTDPLIHRDMVIVGTKKGRIYFLNIYRGTPLWSWRPRIEEVQITGRPLFFKNHLFFISNNGYLYGLKIPDWNDKKSVQCHERGEIFFSPEPPDIKIALVFIARSIKKLIRDIK